jgi:putative zinc finger protein
MNCEETRDRFSSLWEKELAATEEKVLKEHLSSCPECRGEFERFEKTMEWLHSVEEVEVPSGFLQDLSKKREEKKGAIPGEKPKGGWFQFPLSFKLPAQAVAMVAIVFLVLYLTKMMPMERGFLKETKQTSPPLSFQEKPERVSTPPATPGPISEGEGEKRRSELPLSEPAPLVRQSHRPEQSRGTGPGIGGPAPPKAGIMAYQPMESKSEGRERAPSPEPEKIKPPQEIILRISDRKNVVLRLQELVKQFGGEVVATEGDSLLASLPTGSFSKFEKELEGFGSSDKADRLVAKKQAAGSLRLEEKAKREERDEKSKEAVSPAADAEGRTMVRILFVEE